MTNTSGHELRSESPIILLSRDTITLPSKYLYLHPLFSAALSPHLKSDFIINPSSST